MNGQVYPKLLGDKDNADDTYLSTMDVDKGTGNIVYGGYTNSFVITGYLYTRGYVASFRSSDGGYNWARSYYSNNYSTEKVIYVKFNTSGSRLLIILQNSLNTYLILTTQTASTFSIIEFTTSSMFYPGCCLVSGTNKIYFSYNGFFSLDVMYLNFYPYQIDNIFSMNPTPSYTHTQYPFSVLEFGVNENQFIFGGIYKPDDNFVNSFLGYGSITPSIYVRYENSVSCVSCDTGIEIPVHATLHSSGQIFACYEFYNDYRQIYFFRGQTTSQYSENLIFGSPAVGAFKLKCLDIYPKDSNTLFAYLYDAAADQNIYSWVDFTTNMYSQYVLETMQYPIIAAVFINEISAFYGGSSKRVSDQVAHTLILNQPNYFAYVMNFDNTMTCYPEPAPAFSWTDLSATYSTTYFSVLALQTWSVITLVQTKSTTVTSSIIKVSLSNVNSIQQLTCTPFLTTSIDTATSQIAPQTYYINQPTFLIPFAGFTFTTSCVDMQFFYMPTLADDSNIPYFITYSYTNSEFSMQTSFLSDVGSYDIKITGVLQNNEYASMTFHLDVIDICPTLSIIKSAIADTTYDIQSLAFMTITVSWTTTTYTFCPLTFQVKKSDGTAAPAFVISVFTSGTSTAKIKIQTTNSLYKGVWILKLESKIRTFPATLDSEPFQVTIYDSCDTATLSSPIIPDQFYSVLFTAIQQTFSYTPSLSYCGPITYSITSPSPMPAFITIQQTTLPYYIGLYTLLESFCMVYSVSLTGTFQSYPTISLTKTFQVEIDCPCHRQVITNPTITDMTYYRRNVGIPVTLPVFTSSYPYCGPSTYSLLNSDLTAIDTLIFTFTAGTRNFLVDFSDITKQKTYTFIYKVVQPAYSAYFVQSQITFKVQILSAKICDPVYFLASAFATQFYSSYFYQQGFAYLIFFSSLNSLLDCTEVTYFIFDRDTMATFPFIIISGTQIQIDATLSSTIGLWRARFQAVNLLNSPTFTNFDIDIQISAPPKINNPPYFQSAVKMQFAKVGQTITYSLPEKIDIDGDMVTVSIGSGIPDFIQFNVGSNTFSISPQDEKKVGRYSISISLSDTKSQVPYLLIIDVISSQTTTPKLEKPVKVVIPQNISNDLKLKIESISDRGIVKVSFSELMNYPTDISNFTSEYLDSIMNIEIYNSDSQNQTSQLLKYWKVTDFTNSSMTIQINFTDPLKISVSKDNKDKLYIQVNQNQYFRSSQSNSIIQDGFRFQKDIPQQIDTSSKATSLLISGAQAAKGVMQGAIYANLALQIFMSVSLQLMWGMVNTLQIFVHLPLLNINYPANALEFCTTIQDLVNFKLIPSDKILDKMFKFSNSTMNDAFSNMGMKSTNMLKNMGTFLFAFVGIILIIVFLIVIRKLMLRRPLTTKIYNAIHAKIFFNSILRSMLTSFLAMNLSTMISIQNLKFDTAGDIVSSIMTIVTILVIVGFPIFTYIFLERKVNELQKEAFKARYSSLYLNLRVEDYKARLVPLFFLVRRIILALSINFFDAIPALQVGLHMFMSSLLVSYYIVVRPYDNRLFNSVEIMNECCLLIGSYLLIEFTDYESDPIFRYNVGWMLTALMGLNTLANFMALFYKVGTALAQGIKNLIIKFRARKVQKFQEIKYIDTQSFQESEQKFKKNNFIEQQINDIRVNKNRNKILSNDNTVMKYDDFDVPYHYQIQLNQENDLLSAFQQIKKPNSTINLYSHNEFLQADGFKSQNATTTNASALQFTQQEYSPKLMQNQSNQEMISQQHQAPQIFISSPPEQIQITISPQPMKLNQSSSQIDYFSSPQQIMLNGQTKSRKKNPFFSNMKKPMGVQHDFSQFKYKPDSQTQPQHTMDVSDIM